ncbi:hypothetical protein BD410DRAFT_896816 [Rickenella mellea]|uniref:Uncharacterized protein n=1 Tax=Rickenella mellea TaxID=50990 RepID=A0A4Y7QB88_9AGAM|nr:hypothetical protein BD410DRAFT_896816 [Rickenella mellea]
METSYDRPSRPSTPLRGRGRYPPHLTKGEDGTPRVPLHRRGTSRTYERLEDLLREAGYKETRIFTPEGERFEAEAERKKICGERGHGQSGSSSGVGAVVNFLSGIISGSTNDTGKAQVSQGASEHDGRTVVHLDDDSWRPPSPSPSPHYETFSPKSLTDSMSSGQMSTSAPSLKPPVLRVEHVSAARASLRHMVSAPNMPRPAITPKKRSVTTHQQVNGDEPPPLPSNWLQSVAKALLLGVPPHANDEPQSNDAYRAYDSNHLPQKRTLALLDTTNNHGPSPPPCLSTFTTPRTVAKVTTTSVVCRSAPGSRATSRVRGSDSERNKSRRAKKDKEKDRLPSLGATAIEGERGRWATRVDPNGNNRSRPTHAKGSRDVEIITDNYVSDGDSDSDSDADEIDLARLLVPAKRQKSIRSLRRHLHAVETRSQSMIGIRRPASVAEFSANASGSATPRLAPLESNRYVNTMSADDSFEIGLEADMRRRRRGSCDEGDGWEGSECFQDFIATKAAQDAKRRGALPWAGWTNGRP